MKADLKRRKLLFKTKTQLTNSSSGQRGDEQNNIEIDGRMHNGDAEIIDLVGEYLQTKEKTRIGGVW
jgi:hypothetical protein